MPWTSRVPCYTSIFTHASYGDRLRSNRGHWLRRCPRRPAAGHPRRPGPTQPHQAQHAFIYADLHSPDQMRSSWAALKAAGIEAVVLLSHFGVQGDLARISPANLIGYRHAQVELALREGKSLWWKSSIQRGEVRLASPDGVMDWITPEDIGRVSRTILAQWAQGNHPVNLPSALYLVGPNQLTIKDALITIAQTLGKELRVTQVEEGAAVSNLVAEAGLAEDFARYLGNIERYLHRPAIRFPEWV
ncbi:hypothetical protein BO71DRAFT_426484 [Aspergillus ellipticus CBS 707.79]|uniref:NmrA-like domain-containing protein n=1 Tax=Aspergillus ellipticus CBS 707.79 TaxID=1448320 RepID=A0A319DKS0_9EURO|nr:hypothetical protein BO71DRAFT_426484 [Aspergillus ellipticus CBS 707.79]